MREQTKQKYLKLLCHYNRIMKAKGKDATHISKSYLYSLAGQKVNIEGCTAGRIINQFDHDSTWQEEVKRLTEDDL